MDPGVCASGQVREKIFKLLPFVDYFIPSQVEVGSLADQVHEKDHISFLLDKGCRALVLKQSEKGSSFMTQDMHIHAPAISLEGQKINNSTGAGDSFNAGFLYGILTGNTPEQALQFGNAAGYAIITSQHGLLDMIKKDNLVDIISSLHKLDNNIVNVYPLLTENGLIFCGCYAK